MWLYIAIYRLSPTSRWQAFSDGEFTELRLAENFIECKRHAGWWNTAELAIVAGEIIFPKTASDVDEILGAF